MIAALAWKEYREQRAIWIAMACLSVLLSVGATPILIQGNPNFISISLAGFLIVAPAYGLVCGSMLLAGEREAGTLTFLDSLTGRRTQAWTTKLVTGTALTLGQVAVFTLLLLSVLNLRKMPGLDAASVSLTVCRWALEAFVCGFFFSALFRNALSAASISAVTMGLIGYMSLVHSLHFSRLPGDVFLMIQLALTATALLGSWRIFCHDDFSRASGFVPGCVRMVPLRLATRHSQTMILFLGAASFLLGILVPRSCLAWWPFLMLMIGVTCGIRVFTDDWLGASHPLPGGRRRALARRWALASFCWFTVAIGAVLLMFLGATVHLELVDTLNPPNHPGSGSQQDFLRVILVNSLDRPGSILQILDPSLGHGTIFFGHPLLSPVTLLFLAYGFGIAQILMLALKDASAVIAAVLFTLAVGGLCLPGLVSTWPGLWLLLAVPVLLVTAGRLTLLMATRYEIRQRVVRIRIRFEGPMPDTAALGAVLQESSTGNQWQALILNLDRQALERLRSTEGVSDFEETPLAFEEAFIALVGRKVPCEAGDCLPT